MSNSRREPPRAAKTVLTMAATSMRSPFSDGRFVLTDYVTRVLARGDERVQGWFRNEYDVPETAAETMRVIAEHPECRPAGITLRRMKSRGWYADTVRGVRDLVSDAQFGVIASAISATMVRSRDWMPQECGKTEERSEPVSDELWMDAIELVMLCRHFDEYIASLRDPERRAWNWTTVLADDRVLIYFVVYLLKVCEDQSARLDEARAGFRELREHADSVLTAQAAMDELDDVRAACEAAKARLRAELDVSKAEAARLRKRVTALEHANANLTRASEMAVNGSERASERFDSQTGPGTSEPENASEGVPEAEDEGSLPELPETGVVFLGGHERVVRQLRQLHPEWKFVGTVSNAGSLRFGPSAATVVFCWYKHLNHPTFDRTVAALEDVPVVYVSATNISRLEMEMRLHYADVLQKQKED